MSTFLPAGYPDSVSPEYLRYRCWDILQVHPKPRDSVVHSRLQKIKAQEMI